MATIILNILFFGCILLLLCAVYKIGYYKGELNEMHNHAETQSEQFKLLAKKYPHDADFLMDLSDRWATLAMDIRIDK